MQKFALAKRLSFSLLLSAGAMGSTNILAQSSSEEGKEYNAFAMEEIVVQARKKEETLLETPLSVSASSGEQLKFMNITSGDGLSQKTPNLNFSANSMPHT